MTQNPSYHASLSVLPSYPVSLFFSSPISHRILKKKHTSQLALFIPSFREIVHLRQLFENNYRGINFLCIQNEYIWKEWTAYISHALRFCEESHYPRYSLMFLKIFSKFHCLIWSFNTVIGLRDQCSKKSRIPGIHSRLPKKG